MSENCEGCKYYDYLDFCDQSDQDYGHCRRYPPKLIGATPLSVFSNLEPDTSSFPIVVALDWCGEWAAGAAS